MRCINTYEVMRNIITIFIGVLLLLPCLLLLNESENVALNIAGLLYSVSLTSLLKNLKTKIMNKILTTLIAVSLLAFLESIVIVCLILYTCIS